MKPELSICRFLNDAACAYSITYDEGFIEVLANAYPVHRKFGVPGHLDVVAGQLGQVRNCFRSSLNGYFHMGVEHLRFLLGEGWSVGNHSWSHYVYPDQPGLDLRREVIYSKYSLEDRLGCPITHFTIPNDKYNHAPVLPLLKEAGYLSCQNVEGGVNRDDADLFNLGNFMLGSGNIRPRPGWPEELLTENIGMDSLRGGWLCETTHLVQHRPVQDWKNISIDFLEARFEKITAIAGGDLWAATPVDVVDYYLMRRHTRVIAAGEGLFDLEINFPVGVSRQQLTFALDDPDGQITSVQVGDGIVSHRRKDAKVIFTVTELGLRQRRGKTRIKLQTSTPVG